MSYVRAIAVAALAGMLVAWGRPEATAQDSPPDDDLLRVVALIDSQIENHWLAQNVTPTEPADDAEYLRRVSLDITGRIPTAMEVREFLEDVSPDKRRRLVDRLLEDPRYAVHFTH